MVAIVWTASPRQEQAAGLLSRSRGVHAAWTPVFSGLCALSYPSCAPTLVQIKLVPNVESEAGPGSKLMPLVKADALSIGDPSPPSIPTKSFRVALRLLSGHMGEEMIS